MLKLATVLLAVTAALAQQPGPQAEVHPKISWQKCAAGGHCTAQSGGIVLDSEWRWLHNDKNENCFNNNAWSATSCPDPATCAKNCMLEGVTYANYGVSTSGSSLKMNFYTNGAVGSRLYLVDSTGSKYEMFHLLGQEFTYDVDMSTLPCGMNAALYLVSMEADGGMHGNNKAGAKYGTGYCDAQCGNGAKFHQGLANIGNKYGICCAEMDIWEANSMAASYTIHPCTKSGYHTCEGNCGNSAQCDSGGCGFNSYANGDHTFYGPGLHVDTKKVFTVVTQFVEQAGSLHEIKRFYVQGGKVIANSVSKNSNFAGNSLTVDNCAHSTQHGGVKQMGDALKSGMVLTFALWDDVGGQMKWLDAGNNGPCSDSEGKHEDLIKNHPNAYVTYSNMKVGPINSTFSH